jgi:protein-disulfide isomerase
MAWPPRRKSSSAELVNQPIHLATLTVPPDGTDHVHGAAHAPVTVVEYADFECPSCKVAAPTPSLLLARFPGLVRFIFRNFPIEEAHPHALKAAEAAEAAAAQGRFWPMHDLLFQHQDHLKENDLYQYAGQAGLHLARYAAEMQGQVYLQKVREQIEGGRRSHIRATPTFFVNGVVQDISFGMQALHDAVTDAVQRTRQA